MNENTKLGKLSKNLEQTIAYLTHMHISFDMQILTEMAVISNDKDNKTEK